MLVGCLPLLQMAAPPTAQYAQERLLESRQVPLMAQYTQDVLLDQGSEQVNSQQDDHVAANSTIAIAIAGQLRTLLAVPVVASFHTYVPAGDLHIVLESVDATTMSRVHAAYRPVKLTNSSQVTESTLARHWRCSTQDVGGHKFFLQFAAISMVYTDIQETERERGRPYTWCGARSVHACL
jgi:hypothetical protein